MSLFVQSVCGILLASTASAATVDLGAASGFTVLGLDGGEVIINSATSITGDVGYSSGVVSNTNQKVDSFVGTAYVHSDATFDHTSATFAPTGGIMSGTTSDNLLDQANLDAIAASLAISAMSPTQDLGEISDNDSLTLTAGVYTVSDWKYKEDTMTLSGGADDAFFFNISGSFDFDSSTIALTGGVTADNVYFNFMGSPVDTSAAINIGKSDSSFNGTILALNDSVNYHNPASFDGRIIARNINLHSDFNMNGPSTVLAPVPLPASMPMLLSALLGFGLFTRRRISR